MQAAVHPQVPAPLLPLLLGLAQLPSGVQCYQAESATAVVMATRAAAAVVVATMKERHRITATTTRQITRAGKVH